MIDFNKPVTQHSHFTGMESELLVNYFVENEKRNYDYDNVVFAHVTRGMKKVAIPTVLEKDLDLVPEMVIMGTQKLSAQVSLPIATIDAPTLCFTLEISKEKVFKTLDKINEAYSVPNLIKEKQTLEPTSLYFGSSGEMVLDTLKKIQKLLIEDVVYKDYWINLKIEELILCCLQTDMRNTLLYSHTANQLADHPLAHAVKYIKDNLYTRIEIETLANKACMSKPTFFRQFKHNFGMTPISYMHSQRIKEAQALLKNTNKSIADIGYRLGYTNASYFSTQFEKVAKCSPGQYRKNLS